MDAGGAAKVPQLARAALLPSFLRPRAARARTEISAATSQISTSVGIQANQAATTEAAATAEARAPRTTEAVAFSWSQGKTQR